MQRLYFGTDGVRGPYGGPVMNEAFVARLGAAAAAWLESRGVHEGRVLIGRDTRASGASLAGALGDGIFRGGGRPVALGIVPTPAVSRAVRLGGAALGAVITASHNPASDNGFKLFGSDGSKLTDDEEAEIESHIPPAGAAARIGGRPCDIPRESVARGLHRGGGARSCPPARSGAGGSRSTRRTARRAPRARRRSGRSAPRCRAWGTARTGPTSTRASGASTRQAWPRRCARRAPGWGSPTTATATAACCATSSAASWTATRCSRSWRRTRSARGRLAPKTLVVTVQSNLGLDAAVEAAGGRVVRTAVGDRYVAERMRAEGAVLGGESSGHVLCFDFGPTGDGLAAALKVIAVMLETGRPLSRAPQGATEVSRSCRPRSAVREKRPLESLPALSGEIRALERELGARGRVLVRYSGHRAQGAAPGRGARRRGRPLRDGPAARRGAGRPRGPLSARHEVVLRGRSGGVCVAHAFTNPDSGAGRWPWRFSPAPCGRAAEFGARFDEIVARATPAQLYAFLYDMPKGGDLHNHAAGAEPRRVDLRGLHRSRAGTAARPSTRGRASPARPDSVDPAARFQTIRRRTYEMLPDGAKAEFVPLASLTPEERAGWLASTAARRQGGRQARVLLPHLAAPRPAQPVPPARDGAAGREHEGVRRRAPGLPGDAVRRRGDGRQRRRRDPGRRGGRAT